MLDGKKPFGLLQPATGRPVERRKPRLLIGAIWTRLAKEVRGDVYLTDVGADDPGAECREVDWAWYPDENLLLLLNVDLARPHTVETHVRGRKERIVLAPGELRRCPQLPVK